MDRGAADADDGANSPVIRLTTDVVATRDRASLIGDVMSKELAGGAVSGFADAAPSCDWTLRPLALNTVVGHIRQDGFSARRDERLLRDGDADLTLVFVRGGSVAFEQGEHRSVVKAGETLLIAHARTCESWWQSCDLTVLRLPRSALPAADRIERAGGLVLPRRTPATRLLRGYLAGLGPLDGSATHPAFAARHLADLAGAVLDEVAGNGALPVDGTGRPAARLALAREVIHARAHDPGLTMADVAAVIGVSERAGYPLFEQAGLGFTDTLYGVRLDRAAERLRGGYAGRMVDLALDVGFNDPSLFNRRFRARFGMTPSEARARR